MNLDITGWKEFTLGRLFSIKYGVNLELNACDETEDKSAASVNFVSRTAENNGVSSRVMVIDGIEPQKAGLISIAGGGSVLSTFLQDEPFYSGRDLYTLEAREDISDEVKLFIITIIEQNKYKYSYGRQANKTMPYLELLLPIQYNPDGTPVIDATHKYSDEGYLPDWKWMEEYIKSLHHKQLTTKNKVVQIPKLKIDAWKEFKISRTETQAGLLIIENCKCGCAGNLDDGDDINYIGAKKTDNGVMRKVVLENELVSKGNGIMFICDGEGSVGYTNYMDVDFIGSTTTSVGYDDSLNQNNALFIVTVLDKEKFKYSYGRKYRAHIEEIYIKLPIQHNQDGTPVIDDTHKYSEEGYVPDWKFMEDYIKALPYGDRL